MSEPNKPEVPAPEPTPLDRVERLRQQRPPLKERPPQKEGPPPPLRPEQVYQGPKTPQLRELDAEIEDQMREALGDFSEQDLMGGPESAGQTAAAPAEPGRKKGKIIAVHGADIFVDVPGGRGQGVISAQQFPEGVPPIGTEVEISIEGYDNANGLLVLSRRGAAVHADWSTVAEGMVVEARVTETNKGGLAVDVNGIRGFMPISQIDLYRVERPEEYVNQRLLCMVTEVNPEERNLVVSRRALLEREREEAKEKLWNELAEGQTRKGTVRSVKDFGAFVDLGGVDGLLHVSELSWTRVADASQVLQPGQTVEVMVTKLDREKRKVSLSIKQLLPSPWDEVAMKYPPGVVVGGKVTKLMQFGAFVELEPGVEGLVHISELAPQRVFRVSDIVKPEQEVTVKVLNVDKAQKRISLSLKAAQGKPEEPKPEEEPEEEAPADVKPPRPRTRPLRGGIGDKSGNLFGG
ncbi:MAG TPA: S1 RNA-binding domain-containing protein [Gemmataceae bacterium]|nr:S1 RNA-binding domain-containing protein [Gemmataceae bacterium]